MSNLEIYCPYCSNLVHVRQENLGNLLQCPSCPGKFRVPADLAPATSHPTTSHPTNQNPGMGSDSGSGFGSGSRSYRPLAAPRPQAPRPQASRPQASRPQVSRPQVSRPQYQPPMNQGYQLNPPGYSGAYAYQNQVNQSQQSQNMVMMVGGVLIGIFLVLFVALLVLMGTGQLNQYSGTTATTAGEQNFQAADDGNTVASEVQQNKAEPEKNGKLGFEFDPRKIIGPGEIRVIKEEDEEEDENMGFRGSSNDYKPKPPKTPKNAATQSVQ